jgi:hypothetical protein
VVLIGISNIEEVGLIHTHTHGVWVYLVPHVVQKIPLVSAKNSLKSHFDRHAGSCELHRTAGLQSGFLAVVVVQLGVEKGQRCVGRVL